MKYITSAHSSRGGTHIFVSDSAELARYYICHISHVHYESLIVLRGIRRLLALILEGNAVNSHSFSAEIRDRLKLQNRVWVTNQTYA